MHGLVMTVHRFVKISSRFRSTLPTTVQAAASVASMPAGSGPIGFVARAVALAGSFANEARACSYKRTSRRTSASAGGRAEPGERRNVTRVPRVDPPSQDPAGQRLGGLDEDRIVERDRACSGVLVRAAHAADGPLGHVERDHRGIGQVPPPSRVEGAAIASSP